jgi:hypothetical protein
MNGEDSDFDDNEEPQLFDQDHADRPIEFMVQPSDLPTITKLLIYSMMQRVKGAIKTNVY